MEIWKARIKKDATGIYLEDETVGKKTVDDFLSDIAGEIENQYVAIEIRFKTR